MDQKVPESLGKLFEVFEILSKNSRSFHFVNADNCHFSVEQIGTLQSEDLNGLTKPFKAIRIVVNFLFAQPATVGMDFQRIWAEK